MFSALLSYSYSIYLIFPIFFRFSPSLHHCPSPHSRLCLCPSTTTLPPGNVVAVCICHALVYPLKAGLTINSTVMRERKSDKKEKKSLHNIVISKTQTWIPVARQAAIQSLHSPQILLLHTAEPHPLPSTPEGSRYHSTPILTNLCGFKNLHNGV